jgi:hypothetical protein
MENVSLRGIYCYTGEDFFGGLIVEATGLNHSWD